MKDLISAFGMSKQNFYQRLAKLDHRSEEEEQKNYRVTTNSNGVVRFPNLIQDIEVTAVNQVFVSDITYYEMNGGFEYLTYIMDLYNREIVGSSVSDNLRTENTTIPAIRQLVRTRGSQNLEGAILHSERLNGTIKNDYIYPYGPDDRPALKKANKKAIWMYNNEKPHSSLNGLTPVQYRNKNAVDNENISSRYFPLPTAHHHHHINKRERKVMSN